MQPKFDILELSDAEKVRYALKRRQVSIGRILPNENVTTIVQFFEVNYDYPASHVTVHINERSVF